MSIRLSEAATHEVIYRSSGDQQGSLRAGAISEHQFELDHACIRAAFKEISFDGMSIRHGTVRLMEDVDIVEETRTPDVGMYFNLSGDNHTLLIEDGHHLRFSGNQHSIIYTPAFNAQFRSDSKKAEPNHKFEIHLSEARYRELLPIDGALFDSFAERVAMKKTAIMTGQPRTAGARMSSLIQQILDTQRTGIMKRIFLESKVLELLMLQLEQYHGHDHAVSQKNGRSDIDKLYHARTLLEQNMTSPFSLAELAHKTGLNDFKLKKGFKSLFGKTVFGYLHDLRMQRASELLLESRMSIHEISEYCGYSFVQHFVTAFKKAHGITPGRMRRTF